MGDPTTCGDIIAGGSPTVFINGLPAARIGDPTQGHPCGPPTVLATGSSSVFCDGLGMCSVGDSIVPHGTCDDPPHTGVIASGSSDVFIN